MLASNGKPWDHPGAPQLQPRLQALGPSEGLQMEHEGLVADSRVGAVFLPRSDIVEGQRNSSDIQRATSGMPGLRAQRRRGSPEAFIAWHGQGLESGPKGQR